MSHKIIIVKNLFIVLLAFWRTVSSVNKVTVDSLKALDVVPNGTDLRKNELDLQTGLQTSLRGLPLMVINPVSMSRVPKVSGHGAKLCNSFIVVTVIQNLW